MPEAIKLETTDRRCAGCNDMNQMCIVSNSLLAMCTLFNLTEGNEATKQTSLITFLSVDKTL